jgi:hypothetical protein
MESLRRLACISTFIVQGCASQPVTPAIQFESETQPQLIHEEQYPEGTEEQVEDSLNRIRGRIEAAHGSLALHNVQIYCEMNQQAVSCMMKQTEAVLESNSRRAEAIRLCCERSEDPSFITIDVDCFLKAIGSTEILPSTRRVILECRREILGCYRKFMQHDKINTVI